MHANGPLFQPVIVAQRGHATDMHAGDRGSAKVDGDAIGLLVIQRALQGAHGWSSSVAVVMIPHALSSDFPARRRLTFSVEFVHRVDHGDDVFDGRLRLHIVNRVEDEAAARREDFAPAQNLLPNFGRGPEGQAFFACLRLRPRRPVGSPKFAFNCSGSMPVAEHCTGLRMSKPASMKAGRNFETAPQECLKVFHCVCAWIQSLICL